MNHLNQTCVSFEKNGIAHWNIRSSRANWTNDSSSNRPGRLRVMRLTMPRIQNALHLTTILFIAICVSLSSATAQEAGSSSTRDAGAAPLGPLNPANWKMPSFKMPSLEGMLPQAEEKQRIVKKKDSFFSEIGKTVSNSWNRTKEAFNPQKLNPTRFLTASSRTPSKQASESKPGFFSSLFSSGKEDHSKSSTLDFLKRDRPQP